SSSPSIWHGMVCVFAGGPEDKSLVAYDAESGKLEWTSGEGKLSYCSPQPTTIDGVDQLLCTSDMGVSSFDPESGKVLWKHDWECKGMARVVQPTVVDNADVLLGTGFGFGLRRLKLVHEGENWKPEEVWTSRAIKPYYNDFVIHNDHAYGFDNNIFMC